MKRYHSNKERSIRIKRKKFANKIGMEYHAKHNNMNSRHPLDCGRKRCHICHSDKLFGYTKPRDYRESERFEYMIYEQFDHDHERDDWVMFVENYED